MLPLALLSVGNHLQARDETESGADDAVGKILVASAAAFTATQRSNEPALMRAMRGIRDAADSYIEENSERPIRRLSPRKQPQKMLPAKK